MSKHFSFNPVSGSTEKFFKRAKVFDPKNIFENGGKMGVSALAAATPRDTGKTAASWRYTVENVKNNWTLSFFNDDIVDNVVIAVILQFGHLTKNGGFVEGRDYINPALKPVFDKMQSELDKELSNL